MQMLQNHAGAQRAWEAHGGCVHPWGVYKCMGVYENMGAYKHGGVQPPPKYKNMPTTKKLEKKPYLKLNSYT